MGFKAKPAALTKGGVKAIAAVVPINYMTNQRVFIY
jgi:hypothetical protein